MATGVTIGYRVLHAAAGGGGWKDRHWLLPLEVRDPVAPDWPIAKLEFNHAAVADDVWNWRRYVAVDDAVAVVSDHAGDGDRHVLFVGYIADAEWDFDTTGAERCVFTAVGVPFRLARDRQYLVYGRWMWSSGGDATHYSALPCVFNAGGRPNRAATKGEADASYLFTHDDAHDAEYWRAVDALEYLLAAYNADETHLDNPAFTADQQAGPAVGEVDVEALGLWAALAKVADAGGYDVACRIGSLTDRSIAAVKRGSGAEIVLQHQASPAGQWATLDTDKTNLFAARVAEATASAITTPVVAGGRDLMEITIELQKAWDPDRLFLAGEEEVVQPGQEKQSPTAGYVCRYVLGGSDAFRYADAGRLWDANTDGYYSDAPQSCSVPDVAALADETAGTWPAKTYKPRRLVTKLAAGSHDAGKPYFLECTVDGGTNWYPIRGAHVMNDRLGVWLSAKNLAFMPAGDEWNETDNFFRRLIDAPAQVRLRLTCSVATPNRWIVLPARQPTAGTIFETAEFFDKGTLAQRRKVTAGSRFKDLELPTDVTDEAAELERLTQAATTIRQLNEDRYVESSMVLEWIEPTVQLGDHVSRISGIEVDLQTSAGASGVKRSPRVVIRQFNLDPERYQSVYTLDTDRQAAVI